MATTTGTRRSDVRLPSLLLGIGFGGFVDGILLHQILRWHHMISAVDRYPVTTVAGLEANTLADGLFHVATWIAVFVGSVLIFRAWDLGFLVFGALLVAAGWLLHTDRGRPARQ